MKRQITFETDSRLTDWLNDLTKCFNLHSARITRLKHKDRWSTVYFTYRLNVNYK